MYYIGVCIIYVYIEDGHTFIYLFIFVLQGWFEVILKPNKE